MQTGRAAGGAAQFGSQRDGETATVLPLLLPVSSGQACCLQTPCDSRAPTRSLCRLSAQQGVSCRLLSGELRSKLRSCGQGAEG